MRSWTWEENSRESRGSCSGPTYPSLDTVREDIEKKRGYVLKVDGTVAAYMCVDFGGEPAYDDIEGAWLSDRPYVVSHRMAFHKDFRGRGLPKWRSGK